MLHGTPAHPNDPGHIGEVHPFSQIPLILLRLNIQLGRGRPLLNTLLVDIQAVDFKPDMSDLLDIAAECSKGQRGFNRRIAFLIPDTEHRRKPAQYFKTCMDIRGFKFKPFFEYEAAVEWLLDSAIGT